MESFGEVEALDPLSAFLPVLMGHCYAGNRLWADAESAYRRALQRDGDIPEAHVGMAAIELHRKHNAEAAAHALDALGLRYDLPVAHFQLATALARMGQYTEAELALRSSLRMAPGQKNVRRLLAFVLARKTLTQGEAQGRETVASR
jgi:tetratricopeptide (TPR) repeat protein